MTQEGKVIFAIFHMFYDYNIAYEGRLSACKESGVQYPRGYIPGPDTDFVIGQVNSVLNFPVGQVMFLEEFE